MSYFTDAGTFGSPEAAETVARRNGLDQRDFKITKCGDSQWRLEIRANQDRQDDDAFQGRRGFN